MVPSPMLWMGCCSVVTMTSLVMVTSSATASDSSSSTSTVAFSFYCTEISEVVGTSHESLVHDDEAPPLPAALAGAGTAVVCGERHG